jgi:hypothetical protein
LSMCKCFSSDHVLIILYSSQIISIHFF